MLEESNYSAVHHVSGMDLAVATEKSRRASTMKKSNEVWTRKGLFQSNMKFLLLRTTTQIQNGMDHSAFQENKKKKGKSKNWEKNKKQRQKQNNNTQYKNSFSTRTCFDLKLSHSLFI